MEFYEIYRSEGGYRVAAAVRNESPIISSSPFFATRGEAAEWRIKDIERRIAKVTKEAARGDYPLEVAAPIIDYFNSILAVAKKEAA